MRKIAILMIITIAITTMVACSRDQKTEDELKEELKKEVIAELEAEKEAAEKEKKEKILDIRDKEQIYEFIENQYPGVYTREDFDVWEPTYLDLNGDGNEEVIFTAPYGEGKLDNIMFITADSGEYEIIPSNISLEKYENKVEVNGDFITVTQASGGSGVYFKIMGIYRYEGGEIFSTKTNLIMEDVLSTPDGYEALGEIQGDLYDFTYTLKKESLNTGEITIVEKSRYIYNSENMEYSMEYLIQPEKEIDKDKIGPIQLSSKMTKEDIIDLLGNDYKIHKSINEMYGGNSIILDYEDIEFDFFHDSDEIPSDSLPATIKIKSNKYKYDYDVFIGDSAIEAIEKCEQSFENVINHHGLEDQEIPDWFYYKEDEEVYNGKNGDYILTFEYDTGERYMDKNHIPKDAKVTSIKLLGYYD